jgi:hypothetical protein
MQPESVNQPGTQSVPQSAPRTSGSPNVSRLPVQDFLQLANWEGAPVAPPQPPTNITSLSEPAASSAATTSVAVATALSAAEIAAAVAAITDPQMGTPAAPANWQCLTVEQFFARQNWQGLAQPAVPVATVATVVSETPVWQPTLTTTVKDFFQNLPWTAEPTIGAMPKTEAVSAPTEPEMTLSDLSDLF